MRVCVFAVMCDDADNVAAWAETTGDADTRFVLDTGSTDATLSELFLHGIHTLSAPPADVYVRLDAHERLRDGWRAQLADAYERLRATP